jgi:hypothetical protein
MYQQVHIASMQNIYTHLYKYQLRYLHTVTSDFWALNVSVRYGAEFKNKLMGVMVYF